MKQLLLELEGKDKINEFQQKIYESIDKDIHRLCINAENKIKKKMYGKYLWSPKLDKVVLTVQYWGSRKQYYNMEEQTGRVMLSAESLGITDSMGYTLETIEENIQDSNKNSIPLRNRTKNSEFNIFLKWQRSMPLTMTFPERQQLKT